MRIQQLKNESIQAVQEVCVERARYLTQAYRENEADPMIIRRAKALSKVLQNITLFVEEGQLLAGNHAGKLRAASIFPEYCIDWIFEEIDELPKRPGDRFMVSANVKMELLEISQWWRGKTLQDRCIRTLPYEVKKAYEAGVLSANGNMTSGDGHIMLDFEKILRVGASGIIEEAQVALTKLDLTDCQNHRKSLFYQAVIIAYEGVVIYAQRYATLCRELAEQCESLERKAELLELAEVCMQVPKNPARSFYEAIQSVWFVHLISQLESNGHSMSFGRLDQYLYPYFSGDIQNGQISEQKVSDILCCLWIKAFGVVKIRPWSHTRFSGGGPTYQNLTLGGITPEGADAVNRLTMLCLDSIAVTRLPQPNVSARYNKLNPDEYLRRCVEVIRLGFGMPAMHSDELMIDSLVSRGIFRSDANNYAICGCIEPIVPGKYGYRAAGMSFTNFSKILELSLYKGYDRALELALLPAKKGLTEFQSFGEIMDEFRRQMSYFVRLRVSGEHAIDDAIEELVPDAFCSGLITECIQRGKTPKEGGAFYDYVTGPETGIVNAANSLRAIQKLMFGEKRISAEDLQKTLESNFEGLDGENVRLMLINKAEKFGNDLDEADELAAGIYHIFIDEQARYRTARNGRGPIGCVSYPCTATISGNVPSGVKVFASPEGRFAGEPLTEGCSPCHGTDRKGPTAVLRSVAKMPNHLITGGNLLNLKLTPSVLSGEEGIGKMMSLIRAFFDMKGWHVQFNIVSSEMLKDAQKKPDQYKDLVVRVAGYSALFNALEPKTQDDIIDRTEHSF
jgi:formate C-acetyltransferase